MRVAAEGHRWLEGSSRCLPNPGNPRFHGKLLTNLGHPALCVRVGACVAASRKEQPQAES